MPGQDTVKRQISALVKEFLREGGKQFKPGKTRISIATPTFGADEINEAIDSLLSKNVTMGNKVAQFEKKFARYLNVREGVMVNSGSTANLLAFTALTNPVTKLKLRADANEVITTALNWPTTVYSIVQCGLTPVFADIELGTYAISVGEVESAAGNRTAAIAPVHAFGNPCDMRRIIDIASANNSRVIEDCAEAHGAEFRGKKVGSFGDIGTYSFYFSHHIGTIEGGMLVTSDEEYSEMARILRAHGWTRDTKDRKETAKKYPDIDERWLFINLGFNVRPTEIQGAFGIHQIKKLESFVAQRRKNAKLLTRFLSPYRDLFILPKETSGSRHVFLFYPITITENAKIKRDILTAYLERSGIETRPLLAGDITQQPASQFFKFRKASELQNTRSAMRNGFAVGIHHGLGNEEMKYVASRIEDFVSKSSHH